MTGEEFKDKYQTKIDLLKSAGLTPLGFDPGILVSLGHETINLPDPFVELLCGLIAKADLVDELAEIVEALSKSGDEEYPNDTASQNVAKAIPQLILDAKAAVAKAKEAK